jgi:hypothetical protein
VVKPWESGYSCFGGNPIIYSDPSGANGELEVNKESKQVTVKSRLNFYGEDITQDQVDKIGLQIQNEWNSAFGKVNIDGEEYSVIFEIEANIIEDSQVDIMKLNKDPRDNFVKLEKGDGVSYVDANLSDAVFYTGDKEDKFAGKEYVHEFGHMLGWWDKDQAKASLFCGNDNDGTHDYWGIISKDKRLFGIMSPGETSIYDAAALPPRLLKKYGKVGRFTKEDGNAVETTKIDSYGRTVFEVNESNRIVNSRDVRMLGLEYYIHSLKIDIESFKQRIKQQKKDGKSHNEY